MLVNELLSPGHARTLITIEDEEKQNRLAKTIVEKNLNVRETEKLIKNQAAQKKKKKRKAIIDIKKTKKIPGTKFVCNIIE